MSIWLAAALPRCDNIANVRHDGWKFSLKTELWRNFYLFCVVPPPGGDDRRFAFTLRSFLMVCRSDCRCVYLLSLTWIIVIRIQNGFNPPVVVSGIAQINAIHYFLLFLFFMNRESKQFIFIAA